MIQLYVADVGDGLAAGIRIVSGAKLQIDCGTRQSAAHAYDTGLKRILPNYFFLSHFHTDHYNGLFCAGPNEKFAIRRVFFPLLPVFKDRQIFMAYLLTMAYRVMGGVTGSMEADFLNTLRRITTSSFAYYPLSAGNVIDVEGAHFEVLWPPRTLDDKTALAAVSKAITDFEAALNDDPDLQRLHERVQKGGIVDRYLSGEPDEVPVEEASSGTERSLPPRRLPAVVDRANCSLRAAANHLSLALHEDNRFLFFGDLEKHELQQVAAQLVGKGRTSFLATITPHHGSHWHPDLAKINTHYAVTSVGKNLIGKFNPEFKSFGRHCLVTHSNGEIYIPNTFDCDWFGHFF